MPCGPQGRCLTINAAPKGYMCMCQVDGISYTTIDTCPNPCISMPCGPQGRCLTINAAPKGYMCMCQVDGISYTTIDTCPNPCISMPCGPQGRCLTINAAPKGYMCMCQVDGISYTTIDTCPTTSSFCTHMTCKNGGTCVPFSVDDPSCNIGQIGSTCCQCPPNFTGLRCEQEVDFCSSNPCKTNGRCLSDKSGYRCQCYEGYMGENCEVRLTSSGCASNPCTVGICYQLNQNGPSYVCICPDGTLNLSCNSPNSTRNLYTVPTTTITSLMFGHNLKPRGGGSINSVPTVSTCSPTTRDTCNGGQCLMTGTGVYACRCREGYTGAYYINECASNPCLGGGTCYDLVNAYACFCPDRVFRPQCGNISSTSKDTTTTTAGLINTISFTKEEKLFPSECLCRNGGICYTNSASGKLCHCPNGFTGPFCETTITSRINTGQFSCSQASCENGATCQEQGFNTICICKPGFTGQRCEIEYFRCQGNGRFADASNCKQGRYFECVYYGQYDLNLPNGILYSRNCPPGLRFSTLSDRCDYSSVVQC
ncbi:unnamed protein product [Rotaria sp. Silwood1]|nr:unnamed protein product [Rotaria sp. Silwood1]